jgi:hypothetical protein
MATLATGNLLLRLRKGLFGSLRGILEGGTYSNWAKTKEGNRRRGHEECECRGDC